MLIQIMRKKKVLMELYCITGREKGNEHFSQTKEEILASICQGL